MKKNYDSNFLDGLLQETCNISSSANLISCDGPSIPNLFLTIDKEESKEIDQRLDHDDAISLAFLIVEQVKCALQLSIAIEKIHRNVFQHENRELGIVELLVLSAEKNHGRSWEMKLYQALFLLGHQRLLYDLGIEEDEANERLRGATYIKPERTILFRLCQDLQMEEKNKLVELLNEKLGPSPPSSMLEIQILNWKEHTNSPICHHIVSALKQMQRADLIQRFRQDSCGAKECDTHMRPNFEREQSKSEYYEGGPGLCIIINQKNFYKSKVLECVELDDRLGTDRDRDELESTFTLFGGECVIHNNLSRDDMVTNLQKAASKANNLKFYWVAVCILSHGRRLNGVDQVLGCDGLGVDRKEIVNMFADATKCPKLKKKPKMFFFQACRNREDVVGRSSNVGNQSNNIATDAAVPTVGGWPALSDYMVASATIEDFVSYRSTIEGSFFIRHLCKVLQDRGHKESLLDLMTLVSGKVAGYRPDYPSQPETKSTMTKKFMFQRTKESMIRAADMMLRNTMFNQLQNEFLTSTISDPGEQV